MRAAVETERLVLVVPKRCVRVCATPSMYNLLRVALPFWNTAVTWTQRSLRPDELMPQMSPWAVLNPKLPPWRYRSYDAKPIGITASVPSQFIQNETVFVVPLAVLSCGIVTAI